MKIFMDGNAVCIATQHFKDLMSSPVVFVTQGEPNYDLLREIAESPRAALPDYETVGRDLWKALLKQAGDSCPNWGKRDVGIYGSVMSRCNNCDWCACIDALD